MTSEQIRQRSDVLNTQVITRDTGKRLGVVKELLVDIDRREVVALGLRDNLLSVAGMPRFMLLSSISQIGDVILVEDENVIEDIDVDAYSSLINSEVITETGEMLGRVRGFKFNLETGKVLSLIVASLGLPLIPEQVLSTYELPVEEIVSSGPNRLIVFEGAQERLVQLTVGVLERLGIGQPPWEREAEETYYAPVASADKQLGTGVRTPAPEPVRTAAPAAQQWDDDEWQEAQPEPVVRQPLRQQQRAEALYYEQDLQEEENWREAPQRESYESRKYAPPPSRRYEEREYEQEYEYEDVEADAWADDQSPKPYKAPRVNIPEKTKAPEYEEERGY